MTKGFLRRLLVLLLATVLSGGAFFTLLRQQGTRPQAPSLVFADKEPTELDQVKVDNQQGGFVIHYQAQEGGYALGEVPPELIDMDQFIALMVSQARLQAKTQVKEPLAPLSDYGLDQPLARVDLSFSDGRQLSYRLGKQETVSQDYYLQVEGQDGVYTYQKESALPLLLGETGLISRKVTPPLTLSSPLSQIKDVRFSGKHFSQALEITAVLGGSEQVRQEALTFGAATHLVKGRGLHELDQQNGIRVLGTLLDITAIKVLGYNLNQEELAAYGFLDPDLVAEFHLAGRGQASQALTLSLVAAGPDTFYAQVSGRAVVYLINRPAFYDLRYEDLILRYFASPMLVDIKGVTIQSDDKTYEITYEKTPEGKVLVQVNQQPVQTELFYAFYRLLTSAAADGGLIEQNDQAQTPALTITYHYHSPNKPADVLVFSPSSARRMAVSVNGVTELDIRESFVTRLLSACEDLLSGQTIEEVW